MDQKKNRQRTTDRNDKKPQSTDKKNGVQNKNIPESTKSSSSKEINLIDNKQNHKNDKINKSSSFSIDKYNEEVQNQNKTELDKTLLELRQELNKRGQVIFDSVVNSINLNRLDPILEVFKSDPITHQFFINRILELITEHLNSERENYVEFLLHENKNLSNLIIEKDVSFKKDIEMTKELISKYEIHMKEIETAFKEEKDKHRLKENEFIQEINSLKNNYQRLEYEYQKLLNSNNNIIKEKDSLCKQIDSFINNEKIKTNEIQEKVSILENKDKLIKEFEEKFLIMQQNDLDDQKNLEFLISENSSIKIETAKKDRLIEELINKIEDLKIQANHKSNCYEIEIDNLKKINANMNETINGDLQVKIKALKIKLKEKIVNYENLEKKFDDYKKDFNKEVNKNDKRKFSKEKNLIRNEEWLSTNYNN